MGSIPVYLQSAWRQPDGGAMFVSSSMFGHHLQNIGGKHLPGGDDCLFHGDVISIPLFHHFLHRDIGQVKVPEFLQAADADTETTIIDLPYEFGAVDAIVGPFEGVVVWCALKLACRPVEFRDGVRGHDLIGFA